MNLKFIVLSCGYAEEGMTSVLVYQCGFFGHPGYSSYQEAITELALDLYSKYYDEHLSIYQNRYSDRIKKCCREALISNSKANFCAECGNKLADYKFEAEAFQEYIFGLHNTTCDTYGSAEDSPTRIFVWYPFHIGDFIGAPKEEIIYIGENAEVVLLDALLDAKPELRDSNEIYEDWKSKDWESFKNGIQPNYC